MLENREHSGLTTRVEGAELFDHAVFTLGDWWRSWEIFTIQKNKGGNLQDISK